MKMPTAPECFASHMGPWAIEPGFLTAAVSSIQAGMWKGVGARVIAMPSMAAVPVFDPASNPGDPEVMYIRTDAGTAVLQLTGAMMKGRSKFGGVSTVDTRRYLRAAVADPEVGSILLVIDSPGGTVSGTQSLADEIRAADAAKPVVAHIEDLGASAGYWIASQARSVSANRSALVGSLGTFGVIRDTSGQAQAEGVKVHVITTGANKGAGVDGAPITPAQLADAQRVIDDLNALFMGAVQNGRRFTPDQTAALFDGRVHVATSAKSLGLIDAVQSMDQAVAMADGLSNPPPTSNQRRLALAQARGR